ncbi:hypothetical protein Fleli_0371 [Bernardetia litoralis DSM 6794]|uniref:Uncharacterized protein n=1 Tax=Bernardetia litoralis (strain ATCC 23117 / DSM 6794 / NBRC 15988 / NCIMB 1366 / Fx l1 / Sio-4) TaxID=880071 RepID=I4AFW6_BERLS|nr:hypothetical protein [Bernardetia litoralis]AFM02851.1 hypothetical protein Fleli_0371 [Bernardetia litoralis DSM 6794]
MSDIPHIETIFSIKKCSTLKIVDSIHKILLNYNFDIEIYSGFGYINEVEDDDDENLSDNILFDIDSKQDADKFIKILKENPTGGSLKYSAIRGFYETKDNPDFYPYDLIVSYYSFDNQTIEGVLMTIREETYNYFESLFDEINKTIYDEIKPLKAYKRRETDASEIGEKILELYLKGNLTQSIIKEQKLEELFS